MTDINRNMRYKAVKVGLLNSYFTFVFSVKRMASDWKENKQWSEGNESQDRLREQYSHWKGAQVSLSRQITLWNKRKPANKISMISEASS